MKKIAVVAAIALVGLVAFNLWTTGEFAVIPAVGKSEQERKVADLRSEFDAAREQYVQAYRAASVSGIDTTADADAAIGSFRQVKRELASLQPSLSEDRASRRADELAAALKAFEQSL